MIPCGILCHIMPQLFRLCMSLFQCHLLLVIEWRQSRFFLSNVTGNAEQEKRTNTHQIWQKVHKIIRASYVVTKVIMLQNAANHKCHMLSMNMKEVYLNIYMDYMVWRSYRRSRILAKRKNLNDTNNNECISIFYNAYNNWCISRHQKQRSYRMCSIELQMVLLFIEV